MSSRGSRSTMARAVAVAMIIARPGFHADPAAAAGSLTPNNGAVYPGDGRVGTVGDVNARTITNTGDAPVAISDMYLVGAVDDWLGGTDCMEGPLDPGESCNVVFLFAPTAPGSREAYLRVISNAPGFTDLFRLRGDGTTGYYIALNSGAMNQFGDARNLHAGPVALANVVGVATTPTGDGFWRATADGRVDALGDAVHLGDMRGTALTRPIVGIAATATGEGYYLVGSDGGIFAFGDAPFLGSTGGMRINKPIVGMSASPTGRGYWLVASDGGVFAYGVPFRGSTGNMALNRPVVGMASTPSGSGYWLVASDGGIFAFNAPFLGSTGNITLNQPIVGMSPTSAGDGYWFVAADGGLFSYGAPFHGTNLTNRAVERAVGMAGTAPPLPAELASSSIDGRGEMQRTLDLSAV